MISEEFFGPISCMALSGKEPPYEHSDFKLHALKDNNRFLNDDDLGMQYNLLLISPHKKRVTT
jgi:hypothetical protein